MVFESRQNDSLVGCNGLRMITHPPLEQQGMRVAPDMRRTVCINRTCLDHIDNRNCASRKRDPLNFPETGATQKPATESVTEKSSSRFFWLKSFPRKNVHDHLMQVGSNS